MMTFTPAFGLANPHLQTLLPRFIHRNPNSLLLQAVS